MLKTKYFSASFVMFIAIALFIVLDVVGYFFVIHTLKTSHDKTQKILYYEIRQMTDSFISTLLVQYKDQKQDLLERHKEVLHYLETHDYDAPLDTIHQKINEGKANNPYNIYITDENLIIRNTTYKDDVGFDISFAKSLFDAHKKNHEIGLSPPLIPSEIFSYTDSYLPKDHAKRILQVSYKYSNFNELLAIQKKIKDNPSIENFVAFIVHPDGSAWKIYFDDNRFNKPSVTEVLDSKKYAQSIFSSMKINSYVYQASEEGSNNFYALYQNSILDEMQIAFSISMNNNDYNESEKKANLIMFIIAIAGTIAIFLTFKFNQQEAIVLFQNKFIAHSVHEIKTPLSIISLNNELRNIKLGTDHYATQIEGAIRTLKNSYEDMTFLLAQKKLDYPKETINLSAFLRERVAYFEVIALSQSRKINMHIEDNETTISISEVELTRLVDNNLSNAIKYSHIDSTIDVTFEKKQLSIKSIGNPIRDTTKIFHKFVRENDNKGGHGLGLSIVYDICHKYAIDIDLKVSENSNTFIYRFTNGT